MRLQVTRLLEKAWSQSQKEAEKIGWRSSIINFKVIHHSFKHSTDRSLTELRVLYSFNRFSHRASKTMIFLVHSAAGLATGDTFVWECSIKTTKGRLLVVPTNTLLPPSPLQDVEKIRLGGKT